MTLSIVTIREIILRPEKDASSPGQSSLPVTPVTLAMTCGDVVCGLRET